MQAIITKQGENGTYTARAAAGSVRGVRDFALDHEGNHQLAAETLARKMGWDFGTWVGGCLHDGSYAWVCLTNKNPNACLKFTITGIPEAHQPSAKGKWFVVVTSQGYWGRGRTVKEAATNAKCLSKVNVKRGAKALLYTVTIDQPLHAENIESLKGYWGFDEVELHEMGAVVGSYIAPWVTASGSVIAFGCTEPPSAPTYVGELVSVDNDNLVTIKYDGKREILDLTEKHEPLKLG